MKPNETHWLSNSATFTSTSCQRCSTVRLGRVNLDRRDVRTQTREARDGVQRAVDLAARRISGVQSNMRFPLRHEVSHTSLISRAWQIARTVAKSFRNNHKLAACLEMGFAVKVEAMQSCHFGGVRRKRFMRARFNEK